jgi:hypothetical protein
MLFFVVIEAIQVYINCQRMAQETVFYGYHHLKLTNSYRDVHLDKKKPTTLDIATGNHLYQS